MGSPLLYEQGQFKIKLREVEDANVKRAEAGIYEGIYEAEAGSNREGSNKGGSNKGGSNKGGFNGGGSNREGSNKGGSNKTAKFFEASGGEVGRLAYSLGQ